MDRRNFFKKGLKKIAVSAVGVAESRAVKKAKHWIRPPYAKNELDFLLACTRCSACIDICPHNIIFPLPVSRGAEVAQTPALDLLNKGCHLCEDWPCVSVCEPDALRLPTKETWQDKAIESDDAHSIEIDHSEVNVTELDGTVEAMPLPKLAMATINENVCLPFLGPECGACKGICPIPETLTFSAEKPAINLDSCVGCGRCREVCISEPKAVHIYSL